MQSIIASYLFQRGQVQLPRLGLFSATEVPAMTDFLRKKLTAPQWKVQFHPSPDTAASDELVEYIARRQAVSYQEAGNMLQQWSEELHARLQRQGNAELAGMGTFSQDGETLHWVPQSATAAFLPDVAAERVVHPEAQHQMLVGDKETTNVEMSAYYAEETPAKQRWWIAALLLTLTASILILLHCSEQGYHQAALGNGTLLHPPSAPEALHHLLP